MIDQSLENGTTYMKEGKLLISKVTEITKKKEKKMK